VRARRGHIRSYKRFAGCATCSAAICTKLLIRTRPQNHRYTRPTLTSSAPPTCRNLHSLSCRTALPRHCRPTISRRDFVPWRFSAAGRQSAWLDRRHRRPETLHISGLMRRSNCILFDDLVGECEQLVWNGEAERLCSLEVDNQLELDRLLHWQGLSPRSMRSAYAAACRNSSGISTPRTSGRRRQQRHARHGSPAGDSARPVRRSAFGCSWWDPGARSIRDLARLPAPQSLR